MEKILTQKMIEDYQNDGVVFIPGMFKQSVEKLRSGIEQNMKEPGPYATENLHAHELGRFFDDYCNWKRIQPFYEVIQQPFIAEIAAHLMKSQRVQLFHEHVLHTAHHTFDRGFVSDFWELRDVVCERI